MKRRDDDLFQLAFGDIRGDEAESIEATLDATERDLVQELRCLKLDLQSLPVPEHQLSTERLRDAILNEGLQPKPVSQPWWRLAWAPFAAAAIAIVAFQTMNIGLRSEADRVAVVDPVSVSSTSSGLLDFPGPDFVFRPEHWYEAGARTAEPNFAARSTDKRVPSTSRAVSRGRSSEVASRFGGSRSDLPVTAPGVVSPSMDAVPGRSLKSGDGAAADALPVSGNGGVILIGAETDSTTGANRAIEVQDSRDVLIGG